MRLAFITPGFAPDVGGVETVVTELATSIAAMGAAVEVWTQKRGIKKMIADRHGDVVVRRFPCTASEHYPLSLRLWAYTSRHARDFDVVHGHSYHSAASLGMLLTADTVPFLYTPHYHGVGHTAPARMLHRGYRPLGSRLLRRARRVIAVSNAEAHTVEQDFPDIALRVGVIHNGASVASILNAAPLVGQPPTLLALGRLERYKRLDAVIRAFDQTTVTGQLVVIGDGPDRERLQGLAAAARRKNDIRLTGRLEDHEINRWLRTARCVVSLSEHEAFGLVALEAAAGGATALLSDIGAHREVSRLIADCTSIVDPRNIPDVARQLGILLQQPNAGPRPTVRSWAHTAREYREIYEEVVHDVRHRAW